MADSLFDLTKDVRFNFGVMVYNCINRGLGALILFDTLIYLQDGATWLFYGILIACLIVLFVVWNITGDILKNYNRLKPSNY